MRVHGAGKLSIESQATGSERRGEMVTGGATVWGSGEIQSEKDGSGRESHGPSGDDGRVFVMYHGTYHAARGASKAVATNQAAWFLAFG